MYLNIKILRSIVIFFILISPVFLFSIPSEATNIFDLFGIDSFIEIEIDTSFLDDHLSIDKTYIIPITIKYHTNIPLNYKYLPSIILFHTFSKPLHKIHLEIDNPPIWANISINPPEILTYIPFYGEESEISYSYILLKLKKEAPATAYRMNLIIAGKDSLACDVVGSTVLGIEPSSVAHLKEFSELKNRPLDLNEIDIRGEKIKDVIKPLKWDYDSIEIFRQGDVKGVTFQKPGKSWCSGCGINTGAACVIFCKDNPKINLLN